MSSFPLQRALHLTEFGSVPRETKLQFKLLVIWIALCPQWGSSPEANHTRDRRTSALFFFSSKEIAEFLVPLRMQEVCLTPPREARAVPVLSSASSL